MRLYNKFIFPYLDAAGIYAPAYSDEVERFSGLEPLALHYLAESDSPKVETVGDNVRVTFQVKDRWLANAQQFDVERVRKQADNGANTPAFVASEVERVKRWQGMNPTRTVALLLDSKHGYAVAEREEWTAAGQRIVRIVSDDWQHYAAPDIWLPSRCVAFYYTHPLFLAEFSDEPIATVTHQLQHVEFGKKDIPFALQGSAPTPGKPTMRIIDRTTHTRSPFWIYVAVASIGLLIAVFAIQWSRRVRRNN
jgi:hypothetical protein